MRPDLLSAIADGYADAGLSSALIAAKTGVKIDRQRAVYRSRGGTRNLSWTPEEDDTLKRLLGRVDESAIARQLGRSVTAVHIRWKRDLKLTSPSKRADIYTAARFSQAIGAEQHVVTAWCDSGMVSSRRMPGGRTIRLIDRAVAKAWACNPDNWVFFDINKVSDPELARLIRRRAERWGDEWWTTERAAAFHKCSTKCVLQQIKLGRIRGRRVLNLSGRHGAPGWGNWFVLRSDIIGLSIPRGKGGPGQMTNWSREAHAFMLLAIAVGVRWIDLAKMQNAGRATLENRYAVTPKRERIAYLPLKDHAARFPRLARVAAAFKRGDALSVEALRQVISVLKAFARGNTSVVRGLTAPHHSRPSFARVRAYYAALVARGHDPLEVQA
jgi:hypothetical protein